MSSLLRLKSLRFSLHMISWISIGKCMLFVAVLNLIILEIGNNNRQAIKMFWSRARTGKGRNDDKGFGPLLVTSGQFRLIQLFMQLCQCMAGISKVLYKNNPWLYKISEKCLLLDWCCSAVVFIFNNNFISHKNISHD